MSHTLEPWTIVGDMESRIVPVNPVDEEQGDDVCIVDTGADMFVPNGEDTPKHNAERIVACVNGCTGLNPAGYRACVEALKLIVSIIPDGNSPSRLKAKHALALAEGEQP